MAKLIIDKEQKVKGLKKIANAVYKTLNQSANIKAELVFVSKEQIQELNKRTRNIDSVTDVLSYPTLDNIREKVLVRDEHKTSLDGKYIFIGSIVLCLDKVVEQAKEYGHSIERERAYLIVHGLMHLFGYDHIDEQDKKQMREKEKLALSRLRIER